MLQVCFDCYGTYTTDSVYQWDLNRRLAIRGLDYSSAPAIHFSNKKSVEALVVQSTIKNGVIYCEVPNILLQEPYDIVGYVCESLDQEFTTYETIRIPVKQRVKPADYAYENNVEILTYYSLMSEISRVENDCKNDYVTPEMFGAKGDGSTDDTTAIQNAINYATENNKVVKIPAKEYGVKQIKIPSYAKIVGENWRLSTLKSIDSVSMIVFKEDGVKQFHISNINLDGNNVGAVGINFYNTTTQKADTFGVIENISVRRMKQQGIILGERVREMRITNAELYGNAGSGLLLRGCSDSLFNFITSRSNNGIGFEVKGSNNRFVSCKAFCNGSEDSKKVGFDVSDYENAFVGCASQQNTNHGMYIHDAKHITISDFSADANGCLIDKAPETPFASGIKMYNSEHIIISAFATDFLKDVFGLNQKVGITVEACRYFSINLVCRNMITDYVESSLVDYCERDVIVNGVSLAQHKLVNKNNDDMYKMGVVTDARITDSYRNANNGIDLSYYFEDNSLRFEHINDTTRTNIINANNNSIQVGASTKKLGFYGGTGVEKQQIVSNATDLDSVISLANNIKQILLNMNLVK